MDDNERLAKLEAGQQEIMRVLSDIKDDLKAQSGLDVKVARLEERNALLMKLFYAALGTGGAGLAGHIVNVIRSAGG